MGEQLRFEVKTQLKGDMALLQESVRDFVNGLPNQLFGNPIEVDLVAGNNIVPHRFNFIPNGYLLIYKNAVSDIYHYQKPDRSNFYLNTSAPVTIKFVVV